MAIQTIKVGGFVDEEIKKINDNFSQCYTGNVPTKTSDLTNDSNYVTSTDVTTAINTAVGNIDVPTKLSELQNDASYVKITDSAFINKVDAVAGKGLSSNDYTADDKAKVDKLGKIDFTTSNFGSTADANGYYTATVSAAGKYPVKVMRQNGTEYEEVLAHMKKSGDNILIVSSEAFAGYVVTI